MLSYHGDSLLRALTDLFPHLEFDKSRFPSFRWAKVENRRKFFLNYAKTKGFDPLLETNWYNQSTMDVLATKVPLLSLSLTSSICSTYRPHSCS